MKKPKIYWTGFSGGEPYLWGDPRKSPELYRTKREASELFTDVRKVIIVEVKSTKSNVGKSDGN